MANDSNFVLSICFILTCALKKGQHFENRQQKGKSQLTFGCESQIGLKRKNRKKAGLSLSLSLSLGESKRERRRKKGLSFTFILSIKEEVWVQLVGQVCSGLYLTDTLFLTEFQCIAILLVILNRDICKFPVQLIYIWPWLVEEGI